MRSQDSQSLSAIQPNPIKKEREENYREIEREKERLREREKNGQDATNFENHGPDHYKRDGEKDRYRKSEMVKDR